MSAPKYLIDTNVFIGLEDHAEVAPVFAALQQEAARYGVGICVHAASLDDIQRDKDVGRRRVSLSKIQKFPVIARVIGIFSAPHRSIARRRTSRKSPPRRLRCAASCTPSNCR